MLRYFLFNVEDQAVTPDVMLQISPEDPSMSDPSESRAVTAEAPVADMPWNYLVIGGGAAGVAAVHAIELEHANGGPKRRLLHVTDTYSPRQAQMSIVPQLLPVSNTRNSPVTTPPQLPAGIWREVAVLGKSSGSPASARAAPDATAHAAVGDCKEVGALTSCVASGIRVVGFDVDAQHADIQLATGSRVHVPWDRCLLATGGTDAMDLIRASIVSQLPDVAARVAGVRSQADQQWLAALITRGNSHITVVGSSWQALATATGAAGLHFRPKRRSAASAAASSHLGPSSHPGARGCKVMLLCGDSGPMADVLPKYLQSELRRALVRHGVQVEPFASVQFVGPVPPGAAAAGMHSAGSKPRSMGPPQLEVHASRTFDSLRTATWGTDAVVLAPTRVPADTALVDATLHGCNGLEVDPARGGIVASTELLAASNVWVAGEVASVPHPVAGRRRSSALEHAVLTGAVAGMNMTGHRLRYNHIPAEEYHVPALGISSVAVGHTHAARETYGFWAPQSAAKKSKRSRGRFGGYSHGIVFYVEGGKVVGGLLWHVGSPHRDPGLPAAAVDAGWQGAPADIAVSAAAIIRQLMVATAYDPVSNDEDMAALLEVAAPRALFSLEQRAAQAGAKQEQAAAAAHAQQRVQEGGVANLQSTLESRPNPSLLLRSKRMAEQELRLGAVPTLQGTVRLVTRWTPGRLLTDKQAGADQGAEDILPVARFRRRASGGYQPTAGMQTVRAGGVSLAASNPATPAAAMAVHPGTGRGAGHQQQHKKERKGHAAANPVQAPDGKIRASSPANWQDFKQAAYAYSRSSKSTRD